MEGALFPNKPLYSKKPPQSSRPIKFSSVTLPQHPPPSHSPPSLPLHSLLQHLLHLSSPPNTTLNPKTRFPFPLSLHLFTPHFKTSPPCSFETHSCSSSSVRQQYRGRKRLYGYGSLEFLTGQGILMLNSIKEHPLNALLDFFDSLKFELLRIDMFSLLKALDLSGDWERALVLFQWVVSDVGSDSVDLIHIEEYSLDIRAYPTVLHAYSRSGKYKRAMSMFEKMKEMGLSPTLVTYNVMLDVYGRMGRSWNKILGLLDAMRSKGLKFDEFTCSTVISACGREGLLNEAKEFFSGLKSQGYVPGTVTYNALLQVFGKAGVYSEALSILKEMEDNNCLADSVTYNELEEKALRLFRRMKESGCVPNV